MRLDNDSKSISKVINFLKENSDAILKKRRWMRGDRRGDDLVLDYYSDFLKTYQLLCEDFAVYRSSKKPKVREDLFDSISQKVQQAEKIIFDISEV